MRVKCPRCKVVVEASGDSVKCSNCGLAGRVQAPAKPARDPWTITLDLRKLAPRNWSPGAKVLSAFLVLSLVFAAGGFSGIAFERARTAIADDFNAGAGLLGGGSQQPANLTPTDAPQDLDPPVEPSDPPQDPTDPPPEPSDPPPEDPVEPQETVSYQIQGQGSDIKGPFEMPAGLVRAVISYHGDTKFFSVKLHLEVERPELRFDATDSGSLSGVVRYGSFETAGQYYVHTNAGQGETWELDLIAPRGEEPAGSTFSKPGNGDGGLGPFRFTGSHQVSFETPSPYTYHVAVFDAAGNKLGCSFSTGPSTCSVSEETAVYFDVKIKRYEKGWTLKVESG